MQITVNGDRREVPDHLTVAELLAELRRDVRGLAIERNLELVPRSQHGATRLAPGDRIEIVTLVGGG
jgi:sulfur carrier protein